MEEDRLLAKVKSMRTRGKWTPLASAQVPIKQLRASTTLRSKALLITIMLWMKPSLGSCKISRIIDQPNSRISSNQLRVITGFSRTISCCPRRVLTQECSRHFIIANSQHLMGLSRWLEMCIRIIMARKERFKAWKCTYEQSIQPINKSVLKTIWYGEWPRPRAQPKNYPIKLFQTQIYNKLKFQSI